MNKNIIYYLLFVIYYLLFIICSCNNTNKNQNDIPLSYIESSDFVYIKDKHFEINGEHFFPMMLNYCISFRNINDTLVVAPYLNYEKHEEFENNTIIENNNQIRAHFQLIKEMGFNTIRCTFDRFNGKEYSDFSIEKDYEKILEGFQTFVDLASEKDLRIMVLLKPPFDIELENFTIKLLQKFRNNPTIFAYDFFNEPLYFDPVKTRTKEDAYNVTLHWKELMKKNAKNQLFTIGFSEPIEIFEWDPTISPVDFISMHTYHPLRVKSEIYWYSRFCDKPFMIGETALPADDDSISYLHQKLFAKEILQFTIDAGAAGFAWWDFQEDLSSQTTYFEAAYTGLLNHKDTTITKDGQYKIIGTKKPVVDVFENFVYSKSNTFSKPINYYNNLAYHNFVIKGKILNKKTKKPIEGAVIRGWSEWWNIGLNTYTDEEGNFTLYSNIEMQHFELSAPGMTKNKFDKNPDYKAILNKNIDTLIDKEREYHQTSYLPFIKENKESIFIFDTTKFFEAKYQTDFKEIYLSPLNLK